MLARLSSVVLLAMPLLASAGVAPPPTGTCNTQNLQCCNSLQSSSNPSTANLLGLLGVPLQGITAQVGLTCTPISLLAIQGNSCSQQVACCTGNNMNGVVALGCTPFNLNL